MILVWESFSWETGCSLSFDSAFVVASSDLEFAIVSPSFVPAVDDCPVWGSVLDSPSDHLDCMTSKSTSRSVVVNSALVAEEIVVNGESNFNGSVGHDFSLDFSNLRGNTVD